MQKIPYEEACKKVSGGGNIIIRQVTATDRKLEVRERMKKRYAKSNYPEEFPFRCKCILAFQNLDGVDVILFALYLYEHGEDNPAPNKKTVYISYLDSVHFMRPRKLRTFVYHEILIAYLDYARQRGFETAHIWACPPLKGDDYIFYAKPEDQKTPKDNRLRQWYIDMLIECQRRDIVGKVTNMYDLYFAPGIYDATAVPYLEGDYFSGEIENTIKDIEEGKGSKSNGGSKKSKKKKGGTDAKSKKNKSKSGRNGTRSGSAGDILTGNDNIDFAMEAVDPVMDRLGDAIKNMKDSFIVVFLNCGNADPQNLEVPKEIAEQRDIWKEDNSRQLVKRSADGNLKIQNFDAKTGRGLKDEYGKVLKVIDDDKENIDSEMLDNRQQFLDLCKRNYYQFDELRRPKHTSMMVLWHLHNRHAAKFVPTCNSCNREIFSGIRYNCPTCNDYDLCPDCYKNPKTNRGVCTHQLSAKPVDNGDDNKSASGQSQGGIDREKQIKLHIQLLEHASLCQSRQCPSPNCLKMKGYLKHFKECPVSSLVFIEVLWKSFLFGCGLNFHLYL
jgi:E1A/CREB-binding protein